MSVGIGAQTSDRNIYIKQSSRFRKRTGRNGTSQQKHANLIAEVVTIVTEQIVRRCGEAMSARIPGIEIP